MQKLFLSIIGLFFSYTVIATSIVILITPDRILFAADSRTRIRNYHSGKDTFAITSKIIKAGNLYFACSGLSKNENTRFDAIEFAQSYLSLVKKNTYNLRIIDSFKNDLKQKLRTELPYLKANPAALFNLLQSGGVLIEYAIVGINSNLPFAHFIGFEIKDTSKMEIETYESYKTPVGTTWEKYSIFCMGASDAIFNYMDKTETKLSPKNVYKHINFLVSLEIKDKPELVGPPIDILEISNKSIKWIQRKKITPIKP